MASDIPMIVVLALGAGALGGPDALRILVAVAGRNPVVDIGICHFVYSILAAQLFGTALLVRFVRKAPGAGRGAAAADPFAQVTLLLSLAAAFLVAACLAFVSGGLGSVRIPVDLAAEYYPVAAAGAALHYYAMPLLRNFRERRNAPGAAPTERATTTRTRRAAGFAGLPLVAAVCAVAVAVAVAIPFAAHGGPDAPRLSPGFTNMPVAVAVATVVGATLLVRLYRGARNAGDVGGGGATRAPAKAPRVSGASAT